MKEAVGNSFVLNMVVVFVLIAMIVLVGSLSYSKASKVKNNIIGLLDDYIRQNKEFKVLEFSKEVDKDLNKMGYKKNKNGYQTCPITSSNENCVAINPNSIYRYCLYECCSETGIYYKASAYLYFELPLGLGSIQLPITGATQIYQNYQGVHNSHCN